jgi:chromosome segregation ATPase
MSARMYAPALMLALAAATALAQTAPPQQSKPKEKKVWTNDDIPDLRARSHVSVLGEAATESAPKGKEEKEKESAKTAAPKDKTKDPKYYQERLAPLRAQLDQIDSRIKELQDYTAHPTTGAGMVLNQRNLSLSPQNQIDQLQQRRAKIQQQIDDIEDEARSNGVAPGDVR